MKASDQCINVEICCERMHISLPWSCENQAVLNQIHIWLYTTHFRSIQQNSAVCRIVHRATVFYALFSKIDSHQKQLSLLHPIVHCFAVSAYFKYIHPSTLSSTSTSTHLHLHLLAMKELFNTLHSTDHTIIFAVLLSLWWFFDTKINHIFNQSYNQLQI